MNVFLETQEELENSVKALVTQNNKLVELLEKANVRVPHFDAPKLISFIVTVHDDETHDKNDKNDKNNKIENKCIVQQTAACQAVSAKRSDDKPNEVVLKQSNRKPESISTKLTNGTHAEAQPKVQIKILPELKEVTEVQSFGSLDLIPVTNSSRPELKVHEKPVNNFVEITPLLSKHDEKVPTHSDKTCELSPQNQQSNTVQISGEIQIIAIVR